MQRINYHIRIAFVVVSLAASLVILALSQTVGMSILSVVLASASAGLGEITFLSFTSLFKRSTVSAWSSGAGMSGVTGSVAYAGLRQIGLSKRNAVLSLLVLPIVWAGSVWGLLKFPPTTTTVTAASKSSDGGSPSVQSDQKSRPRFSRKTGSCLFLTDDS